MPWPRLVARELTLTYTAAEVRVWPRLRGLLTVRSGRIVVALRGVIR